jgi:DNA ligase 1
MEKHKVYKRDTKGKTRVWWIEYTPESYRVHAGLLNGKIVVSGWKYPDKKNVGKINETSITEQVLNEVESLYEKQTYQGGYHVNLDDISEGAKFFEPMLADTYNPKKHDKFPYFAQPKLDGIRCIAAKGSLFSRNGKPFVATPHIQDFLDYNFFTKFSTVALDGELYNHLLRDKFEKIVSLVRKTKPKDEDIVETSKIVEYHVYDCFLGGDETFEERHAFLKENLEPLAKELGGKIVIVDIEKVISETDVENSLSKYLELGYEGQMLRVSSSKYLNKRTSNLVKNKEFEDGEFEIVSVVEGEGNWAGYAKSIEIRLKDGTTQHSGMRGNQDFTKQILSEADTLVGTEVTVRYQNRTEDGKLRFPVVTFFWRGVRDV